MEDYELVLKFLDQSPSFAFGFECGQLYDQMSRGIEIVGEMIHTEIRDQVELMCKHFLYDYEISVSVNGWNGFSAKPSGRQN